MNDLDVNIVIQAFTEKVAQLTTELVVKEATIKQLNAKLSALTASLMPAPAESARKERQVKSGENTDK